MSDDRNVFSFIGLSLKTIYTYLYNTFYFNKIGFYPNNTYRICMEQMNDVLSIEVWGTINFNGQFFNNARLIKEKELQS